MTDKQFLELISAVKVQPPTPAQVWFDRFRLASYILSIVIGVLIYFQLQKNAEQAEMIKAYFSGQQSKYAELIGTLKGQGDKKTADILEILKDQQKKDFYSEFENIKQEK